MNFKHIWQSALGIWKDPVWSKVISAAIIALVLLIWAKITKYTWKEIYDFVLCSLSLKLPVYFFLSVIAIFLGTKLCIQFFKRRKDPLWDEQMGNYTFKELYNILRTEKLPARTTGMIMSEMEAPTDDLLFLFRVSYLELNKGLGFDHDLKDGGYTYTYLAPRLVGFGLVEVYQKPLGYAPDFKKTAYKTSDLGHKFHASLDKVDLAERMKELRTKKK